MQCVEATPIDMLGCRMSRRRRWLVHALVMVVLGGNLVSLATNIQVWPYSPYPMFADARFEDLRTFRSLVLVGESTDGREFWFENEGYLGPLSPQIISWVFAFAGGDEGVQRRLRDAYELCERRRLLGLTNAPPLERVVLYRFTWKLQPDLSNVRSPARARLAAYPIDAGTRP